jgi:hypothetical protein
MDALNIQHGGTHYIDAAAQPHELLEAGWCGHVDLAPFVMAWLAEAPDALDARKAQHHLDLLALAQHRDTRAYHYGGALKRLIRGGRI